MILTLRLEQTTSWNKNVQMEYQTIYVILQTWFTSTQCQENIHDERMEYNVDFVACHTYFR